MASIDKEILHEFLWTTREECQRLEAALLDLERQGVTPGCIDALYRHFHSLKGAAGLIQLVRMEQATHACESLLAPLRTGSAIPAEAVATMLQCVDGVKRLLVRLDAGQAEEPDAFADLLGPPAGSPASAPAASPPPAAGNDLDSLIALMAMEQAAGPAPEAQPAQPAAPSRESEPAAAPVPAAPAPVAKTDVAPPRPKAASDAPQPAEAADTAVRIDIALLDKLMTLVGELVLARNQLLRLVDRSGDNDLAATAQAINQVTSDVQEHVMRTRMQPIGSIFGKLPRLLRDLSRQLEKQIDLDIQGKETELDRTILESLRDPFTHIIRNACDHGVERPEVRTAAGKPAKGTITIRAFHEGGQVIVEIQDDGRGIDAERVKAKAVSQNVLTPDQAARLSDKDAFALICHPGLSTAEQVTNISGRGVGMDVVKKNIEKLGGQLEIASILGRGTTIRLRIPLTLAIIPALMVRSADQLFGIPQVNLVEVVRIDDGFGPGRIEQVRGAEVYRLRNELLTLIRLDRLLGVDSRPHPAGQPFYIAVVVNGQQRFGIIVDAIQDSEEIVVKPLSRHLSGIDVFAGATIRGDGRVALILDVAGVAHGLGDSEAAVEVQHAEDDSHIDQGEFLIFDLGNAEQFAVPLQLVNRLERFETSVLTTVNGMPVICHDGHLIPTIDLATHLRSAPLVQDDQPIFAILMQHASGAAILAKRVVDSRTLDLQAALDGHAIDRGDCSLGMLVVEGLPTTLIDAPRLLDRAFPERAPRQHAITAPASAPMPSLGSPVPASAMPPSTNGKRPTVLYCEDAQFFQKVIGSYLQDAGYGVVICQNGKEGWERLEREPDRFSLLITDLEMPEMDGWELIKQIRQFPHFDRLPVVALTSLNDEAVHQRTLQFGASEFAVKLKRDELLSIVRRHIPDQPEVSR